MGFQTKPACCCHGISNGSCWKQRWVRGKEVHTSVQTLQKPKNRIGAIGGVSYRAQTSPKWSLSELAGKKMRNSALKNPRLLHARALHAFSWVETELCARTWNASMHSPPPEAHSPFNAALCPVRTQGGGGGLRALQNPHRNANIGAPISSTTSDAFRRAKKKIEPSAGCASGQSGGVALCFDRVLPFLLCSNAYLCFASSQKVL